MARGRGQTMIYITLHTTLTIEQHEHHKNPGELRSSTSGTRRVTAVLHFTASDYPLGTAELMQFDTWVFRHAVTSSKNLRSQLKTKKNPRVFRHPVQYDTFLSWIFIVLAHWNNRPRVDMSLHSDTLFRFRANQFLLFLLNAACLAEKQQIPIL
jgi:hypothetical protein